MAAIWIFHAFTSGVADSYVVLCCSSDLHESVFLCDATTGRRFLVFFFPSPCGRTKHRNTRSKQSPLSKIFLLLRVSVLILFLLHLQPEIMSNIMEGVRVLDDFFRIQSNKCIAKPVLACPKHNGEPKVYSAGEVEALVERAARVLCTQVSALHVSFALGEITHTTLIYSSRTEQMHLWWELLGLPIWNF